MRILKIFFTTGALSCRRHAMLWSLCRFAASTMLNVVTIAAVADPGEELASEPSIHIVAGPNPIETKDHEVRQWLANEESRWSIRNPTNRVQLCYITFTAYLGPDLSGRTAATLIIRSGDTSRQLDIHNERLVGFTHELLPGTNDINLSILEPSAKSPDSRNRRHLLVMAVAPKVTCHSTWNASAPLGLELSQDGTEFRWLGGHHEIVIDGFAAKSGAVTLSFTTFRGPAAPQGLCLLQVRTPDGRTHAIDVKDGTATAIRMNVPAGHFTAILRSLPRPIPQKKGYPKRPTVAMVRNLEVRFDRQN